MERARAIQAQRLAEKQAKYLAAEQELEASLRDDIKAAAGTTISTEFSKESAIARGVEFAEKYKTAAPKLSDMSETEVVEELPELDEIITPKRADLKLDADQLAAIELGCTEQYCNIVGSAGTGKTSTVMKLIDTLAEREVVKTFSQISRVAPDHLKHVSSSLAIGICAFTGQAKDTIMRAVPQQYKSYVYTIHKLVDVGPQEVETSANENDVEIGRAEFVGQALTKKLMLPRRDVNNKLPFQVVVIDEISMTGMGLLQWLLDALRPDCRIITIGDLAQLTPVMDTPSHPLLINAWPTQELKTIYRQKDGDLIDNANRIRVGDKPQINDNFKAVVIPNDGVQASRYVTKFIEKEFNEGRYDPMQDLLITPHNVGPLGQEILNVKARLFLNPNNVVQSIRTMRGIERYAVGDRIVNRKNDYEIGVTNGMAGTIKEINLQAGMAKYSDQGLQTQDQKDAVADSLANAIEDLEAEQKVKHMQKKLSGFNFGGKQVNEAEDLPVDNDAEGTAKRAASHSILTQFDYVKEDSPTGSEYLIPMHQSTQISSLQLGWWITVYVAQGSSARNVYVLLHPEHGKALNREMLYTAVTRARDNVTLLTTNMAINKSLRKQLIPGDTMEDKIAQYMAKIKTQKSDRKFDIPTAR